MRRYAAALILIIAWILPAASASSYSDSTVLGTVESLQQATNNFGNLTMEMELCDTVADAVRSACGCQIAIVNGGDLIHNLEGGEATWGDILFLFAENRPLAKTEISGADLLRILEHGVSYAVMDLSNETLDVEASVFEGFPQISGFSFTYDLSAPVGQRIIYAELPDGTLISEDMVLTLGATEYMLSGGFGYPEVPHEGMDQTLAGAMASYFEGNTLGDPEMKRITCIGVSDRFAIPRPTIFVISIAVIIAALCFGKARQRTKKENELF